MKIQRISQIGAAGMAAEQRGGHILISVSDDGRGIDRARVFQKAVDRKIVAADEHAILEYW